MKTKKIIFNDEGYVLFVDSQDEDLIYATLKDDFQKAMTVKSQYSDSETVPEDLTIKVVRLSIVNSNENEETYDVIDTTPYEMPLILLCQVTVFS